MGWMMRRRVEGRAGGVGAVVGEGRTRTKGNQMRGVNDNIYDYVSHSPELVELGVLSHLELAIPFGFGGQ